MSLTSEEWELLLDVLGEAIATRKSRAEEYRKKVSGGDPRLSRFYEITARMNERIAKKIEKLFSKIFYEEGDMNDDYHPQNI